MKKNGGIDETIQSAIEEYLSLLNFGGTLKHFRNERKRQSHKKGNPSREIRWGQTKEEIKMSMLDAFDSGNHQVFFRLWHSHLPNELSDLTTATARQQLLWEKAQALEFYINIHFAVLPFTDEFLAVASTEQDAEDRCAQAMTTLQKYLDGQGSFLSRKEEFLPYFSLPVVPDPMTHPAFRELFEEEWSEALRQELESFLDQNSLAPHKIAMYDAFQQRDWHTRGVETKRSSSFVDDDDLSHLTEDSHSEEAPSQSQVRPRRHARSRNVSKSRRRKTTFHRTSQMGRSRDVSFMREEDQLRKVYQNREEKLLNFARTIFSVCVEILQALERCRNGKSVSDRYMISMKARLDAFNEVLKEVWRVKSPHVKLKVKMNERQRKSLPPKIKGAAAMADDSSVASASSYDMDDDASMNSTADANHHIRRLRPSVDHSRISNLNSTNGSMASTGNSYVTCRHVARGATVPLDFVLIRAELRRMCHRAHEMPTSQEGIEGALAGCCLFQALRWRLARAPNAEMRKAIVRDYLHGLGGIITLEKNMAVSPTSLERESLLVALLSPQLSDHHQPELLLAEYLARFLATLCASRQYRAAVFKQDKGAPFVELVLNWLITEEADSSISQHLLGALQKCSLRRGAQRTMVKFGVLDWAFQRLDQYRQSLGGSGLQTRVRGYSGVSDSGPTLGPTAWFLSDYSLEYITALLMNLCLTVEGKIRAERVCPDPIHLLDFMLDTQNLQVRHYIHGSLYGLLSRREMRHRAREYGLEQKLNILLEKLGRNFQRQIKYILQMLAKPDSEAPDDSELDMDSTHDNDDVEEENYVCTDDLPENGHVVEYGMTSDTGTGEELLCRLYAVQDDSPRTTMPRPYAQAQLQSDHMPRHFKSLRLKTKASPPQNEPPKRTSPARRSMTDNSMLLSPIEQQTKPNLRRSKSSLPSEDTFSRPSLERLPSDTSNKGQKIYPIVSPHIGKIQTLDEEYTSDGILHQSPAASFDRDPGTRPDSKDPFRKREKLRRTAPMGN